jgi:hypothetical protein
VPIVRELTLYPVVELGNVNPDRWRRMVSQLVRAGVVPEGTALSIDDFFFDPERDPRPAAEAAAGVAALVARRVGRGRPRGGRVVALAAPRRADGAA